MTYLCMAAVIFALAATILWNIRYSENRNSFFNVSDTTALRGFWCLIAVLVHIPAAYGNRIQDMIGSFGYLGVTFFFMTSGYGLKYGLKNKKNYLNGFWYSRLPKLIVPVVFVNIANSLISTCLYGKEFRLLSLLIINNWVILLLLCYLAFWIGNRIPWPQCFCSKYCTYLFVCFWVILYSFLCEMNIFTIGAGWSVEVLGFLYGIFFADYAEKFKKRQNERWLQKGIFLFVGSLILGVSYLKWKSVFFFGSYLLRIALGISITWLILHFMIRFQIDNPLCRFLGSVSYEVYLFHEIAFSVVVFLNPAMNSGVFILLSLILTVLTGWCIRILSERFCQNFLKC